MEDTAIAMPGLQRSQFSPQKKQEFMLCRTSERYVLVVFLAVRQEE